MEKEVSRSESSKVEEQLHCMQQEVLYIVAYSLQLLLKCAQHICDITIYSTVAYSSDSVVVSVAL